MTKKLAQVLLIVVLIISTVVTGLLMLAQSRNPLLLFVAANSQKLSFYGYMANGTLQAIGEPLANFAIENLGGNAEWLVYSQENFAASPNGQYIAFTAKRGDEATLFVYAVSSQSLRQKRIISYSFLPTWSPDSEAIFLGHGIPDESDLSLPDGYVYELASDSLFEVVQTLNHSFQWSPDGDSLIYLGSCLPEDCGNRSAELYWVSRDGSKRFPMTDFASQISPDTYIDVCHLAWDATSERWYYVVGCGSSFDNPNTYIYSTNLNGDNRLELDVEEYLKSTDGAGITMQSGLLKGIEARSDGIYISLELSFYPDTNLHPEIEEAYLWYQWRVLRLASQGRLDLIHQEELVDGAEPVISPDRQAMALLHDGAIIVNLANNESSIVVPNLADYEDRAICDIRWLNNETIVYNVGGHQCFYTPVIEPKEAWSFDITTGEVRNLTESLGDHAWLLPSSQN